MSDIDIDTDDVAENSDLTPEEKETNVTFDKRDDVAKVFTAEAGIMRRLIQHPEADIVSCVERGGSVVGLNAELPVGCISIKASPRKHGGHANVVTSSVMRDEQ